MLAFRARKVLRYSPGEAIAATLFRTGLRQLSLGEFPAETDVEVPSSRLRDLVVIDVIITLTTETVGVEQRE